MSLARGGILEALVAEFVADAERSGDAPDLEGFIARLKEVPVAGRVLSAIAAEMTADGALSQLEAAHRVVAAAHRELEAEASETARRLQPISSELWERVEERLPALLEDLGLTDFKINTMYGSQVEAVPGFRSEHPRVELLVDDLPNQTNPQGNRILEPEEIATRVASRVREVVGDSVRRASDLSKALERLVVDAEDFSAVEVTVGRPCSY